MANKPWHRSPEYRRARARLIPAAYRDPGYRCPTCGLTLDEIRQTKPGARWDLGHNIPGDTRLVAGARPQCSPCNRADGARMTNARRADHGSGYGW